MQIYVDVGKQNRNTPSGKTMNNKILNCAYRLGLLYPRAEFILIMR